VVTEFLKIVSPISILMSNIQGEQFFTQFAVVEQVKRL
jgi:hypothetical protein